VQAELDHPGVVPVYGLGCYDDGRPYYAMRFITGRSLQDALDEFHAADTEGRDPQERTFALRQLLRRFTDVCNTIGYAHSRGILHRDIKPANVMLGGFGETLVVDWGLAKEMVDDAVPMAKPAEGETAEHEPLGDFEETREGFTMYGQTMGTPAYMSPEQAAGKWDVTGVASDVYSLGAMLYAMLCGTPPYSGPSFEVITRVQKGDYKPVRLVKSSVSATLDAIVRKAMAFAITDRYANALALAADVERWLADEPVSCFREPFVVRASRWAKRHRTGVITAAVVLMTGTIALTVGLFAVSAEQKRTEVAKLEALESRGEAREALNTLTDDAVGEVLAGSAKPTPQQVKFLDSLIGTYRRFAEKEADSPETNFFIAGAWYRIGRLEARVDRTSEARAAYGRSIEILAEPAVARLPDAVKTRGNVELYRGILELTHSTPAASKWLQEAIDTFSTLVQSDPQPEHRLRLSQAQDRFGAWLMTQRKPAEAQGLFQQSLALRQELEKQSPLDPEYRFRVAQSHRQLASVAFALGRPAEGFQEAGLARSIQEKLVHENPSSAPYLALLADIESELAVHHTPRTAEVATVAAKDSAAVLHARNAVKAWGRLVALNPADNKYLRGQADANINLARQYQLHRKPREAIDAIKLAVDLLNQLDADEPGVLLTQIKRLQALVAQTQILRAAGEKAEVDAVATAVQAATVLIDRKATDPLAQVAIAEALLNRARVLIDAKSYEAAGADLDAVIARLKAAPDFRAAGLFQQTFADWMEATEQYGEVAKIAAELAALPLPGGQGHYVAACFYGRAAKQIQTATFVADDQKIAFAQKLKSNAIAQLLLAVKAGYTDTAELEANADLAEPRSTAEFKDVLELIKPKKPRPRDN